MKLTPVGPCSIGDLVADFTPLQAQLHVTDEAGNHDRIFLIAQKGERVAATSVLPWYV